MTAAALARRPALVFHVGARVLAVDAAEVVMVARRPRLTRVPQGPAALAGMGALKGRAVPIIELARLLNEGDGGGAQMLVLQGEDSVAVAVDSVEGIREWDGAAAADWLDLRSLIAQVFRSDAGRRRAALPAAPKEEARPDAGGRALSFLECVVAGQRFGFPMAEVQAVIRAPAELVVVPDADPIVCGLTPYGDGVLPVVELAQLLGLPPPARGAPSRLFVVEIGGSSVGLRVERVLGALRVESRAVIRAPAVLNRGAGEARVAAIARTPSGLTAILAVERLFDEATMRRLNALAAPAGAQERPIAAVGDGEAVVVFRVGEERYGLPAAAVEAVARPPAKFTAPPHGPSLLAGVMSHRGEATPLVDARLRFDAAAAAPGAVIFVRSGAIAAGLLVDAVERLARFSRSDLERAPPLAGDAGALFPRLSVAELDGRPLLLVDADSLLGQAQRDLAAWSAGRPPRAGS